jgi:NAD(P)-dependent dehydrogenase (short-subunit alcohol dehydrogenase family)
LQPVPAETADGTLDLKSSDVVAITGGARGVTAACALALARASSAAIALIGRSPAPFQVPSWLAGIQNEAAMKKAIVQHAFSDSQPTPKELEAEFKRQKANQAIAGTLQRLQDTGVRAAYFCADVTDAEGLKAAADEIRSTLGPIAAVIHGAGVLHDRLIVDKSVDQFRQVYNTKVQGFKNLLEATESDPLRHLVLFSSVSARTGNTGQCDYAMANEVLNKMARVASLQRSGCRVSSINWGPWDGGMVTPSLKKAFQGQQIDLIPVETGADLMVAEMKNADPAPVEVLIGSMLETPSVEDEANGAAMDLLERRELDLQRYPVLASHVIGGKPVVPFALIGEWIGHGAVKENPGFTLHGIDDFRLLSGIRIEQEKKLVRLLAGKARKNGNGWHVAVELRNGVKNGKDVIHSRARALLVDRLPDAPTYKGNGKNGSRPYPRDLDAVYGEILFHGDKLRAIQHIKAYSEHGMTARLTGAPKPEAWMQDPIRERWTADPMVLDGAFQMAIVWSFEQTGSVCLPSYARSYRQYRPAFPESGVTAVMTVTRHSHRKMVADFTFLDADEQVVATLMGYEATVDQTLIHAFRNNGQPSVIH